MRSLYPGAVATIALWKSAPVLRRTSRGPPRHCFRHVRQCVRVCKRATGSFSLVKLLIRLKLVKLLVNVNVCPPLLLGDCYTYSDSVDNCGCCCCDISASASPLQTLSPQALTDAHTPSQWSPVATHAILQPVGNNLSIRPTTALPRTSVEKVVFIWIRPILKTRMRLQKCQDFG